MIGLMLLALAFRAIMPQGYMPTVTADGFAITICTPDGLQTIASSTSPSETPANSEHGSSDYCAFAVAQSSAVTASNIAPLAPALIAVATLSTAPIADLTTHRLAAPPPPSQAPPTQG